MGNKVTLLPLYVVCSHGDHVDAHADMLICDICDYSLTYPFRYCGCHVSEYKGFLSPKLAS